ncbi:MAG TPA: LPS export ABC transporter periplasmic protein LptC [Syntrophales bacterium]|nr:LPS export ABC transporter periplasmic protein LptC [Syntrophales bacterium]HOL59817.1 LPS export ABC transporter periplasmic protein LptC [Syntrophales bacterium]HPO35965.1 LPS export ABC transporter periplasmic protein LptC [Syntrophales bacterium]
MARKSKTWIFIVVLMVGAAALFITLERGKKEIPLKIIPEGIDIQAQDVVYTDLGKDGTKLEIRAKKGEYLRGEGKAVFEQIYAVIERPGGERYIVTGDRAVMGTENKTADIYGHVVITSNRGDRITTDSIHYSEKDRKLWTNDKVYHEGPRMKIQGRGLVVYLDRKELRLKENVKALVDKP